MDFKLPTFSAVVLGVVGWMFSVFFSMDLKIIEGTVPNAIAEGFPVYLANPIFGSFIGIVAGFVIGLVIESIFSRKKEFFKKV